MRLALAVAAGLAAGPSLAGCFTAEELPKAAVYDSGSVVEYMQLDGDVLTYKSDQVITRVKAGLWPLDHRAYDGSLVRYRWDSLQPDLARVISMGGKARVEGRMQQGEADWVAVVAEVQVLRQESLDWEDCRYKVVEFRKTIEADGKKVSEAVVLYAPEAMIAFRTDAVDTGSGKVSSHRLTELR